jgi:membrane-bound serine protease (ClpP class)
MRSTLLCLWSRRDAATRVGVRGSLQRLFPVRATRNWLRAFALAGLVLGLFGLIVGPQHAQASAFTTSPPEATPPHSVLAQMLPGLPKQKGAESDKKEGPSKEEAQPSNAGPFVDPDFVEASPEELLEQFPRPPPLPDLLERPGPVVVIPIHGTIELGLAPFVSRAIRQAEDGTDGDKAGDAPGTEAAVIILDVNTFGGRVDAAVEIRDAVLSTDIPTVAYVDRRAISAGALISLAADYIVFAPGGTLGAATPIQVSDGKAKPVGEKMVSYMRSEMRSTAEANDRNGDIAASMVDADLTVPGVIPRGKLLTVTTELADQIGLANAVIDDLDGVIQALGLEGRPVIRPTANWAEQFARFITEPTVSGILVSVGMLALMIELYSPGFGIAGAIGLGCLGLYLGGHLIVGLAGWEEIILVIGGIVLIGVEIFVIPGFGIAGVLGICMLVAGLALAMLNTPIGVAWETGALMDAVGVIVIALIAGLVGLPILLWILRKLGVMPTPEREGGWLVLKTTLVKAHSGYEPALADEEKAARFKGKEGVAVTDLRPAGNAEVDGEVLDVVSAHGYIDQGQRVRVTAVEGLRIVVAQIK